MNTTLPTHTKRQGPFPCKGCSNEHSPRLPLTGAKFRFQGSPHPSNASLTPTQAAWMRENKPLYYTGIAINDLPHIPQHLRFV